MSKFYPLKVSEVRRETSDCVSVAFELNGAESDQFKFKAGQYLTLKHNINGEDVRRSYSICSSPTEDELRVAIKKVVGGKFSTYANEVLEAGTLIDVMPPQGNFKRKGSDKKSAKFVAFAAGSGITPIISLIKDILNTDDSAEFTLFYGNKASDHIIFKEELEGIKNKFLNRFQAFYILSQEVQETPVFNGRLDGEKIGLYAKYFFEPASIDQYFLCGPEQMIWSVKESLEKLSVTPERISFELFTTSTPKTHEAFTGKLKKEEESNKSQITVILDGIQFDFPLAYKGQSILDAALKTGADLPFACKGGVCCTCKAKILEGEVEMEVNYALEKDEVEAGYVLTCQSHPRTATVKVDYDV